MAKKSKNTVQQFGTRYGAKNRQKVATAKKQYLKKNMKSPITGKVGGVKRLSAGIFVCRKTGIKFVGKAYSPVVSKRIVEE